MTIKHILQIDIAVIKQIASKTGLQSIKWI